MSGGCDLPPAVGRPAVGFEGGDVYEFGGFIANDWVGFISWTGTEWRCVVIIGPLDPWVGSNTLMTYNATTRTWRCSASSNCGPGYSCTLDYDIEFVPELWATEQQVRADIDEITPDGLAVWHWRTTTAELPGARRKVITDGGRLWAPDHVRGLTRKFRSVSLPPVSSGRVWWEY